MAVQATSGENILSKSPNWWQALIAAAGMVLLAYGKVGDYDSKMQVVQYQNTLSINDRAALHAEMEMVHTKMEALSTEQHTDMMLVSDKVTRLETLMQEYLRRQHGGNATNER